MEEKHRTGMEEGLKASMPSPGVPLSPNLHMFTNQEGLQLGSFPNPLCLSFYGGFIT